MIGETTLVRAFRRGDLTLFAVNSVIGAGIFGIPALMYARVGAASVFTILAAAIVVSFITLCFAEVGSRFDQTGGPYLYALQSFGPLAGFQVGYLLWVARLLGFAAVLNLLLDYASYLAPSLAEGVPRTLAAVLVIGSLTGINLVGVRRAALVNNLLTIVKLVPLFAFIFVGLAFVNWHAVGAIHSPAAPQFTASLLLAIYAFSGFEILSIPGGEIQDPARTIPLALLGGLGIVTLVYLGVQLVAVGTLPGLGSSTRPLADAARSTLGPAAATFMVVGAVLSTLGVAHTIVLAAARLPFALAEQGQLPRWMAGVHPRFRTPWVGLFISAACMLAITLASSFASAATFTVEVRILTYLVTCAALPVFRARREAAPPGFAAPAGVAIAMLSVLICIGLLATRPMKEIGQLLAAIGLGLAIYVAMNVRREA